MKVEFECLTCLVHRGYLEIAQSTRNPVLQFKAASALLDCLSKEFKPEAVAAVLGTMRDRIVKQVTGNLDVYAERKRASNRMALQISPRVQAIVERQSSPRQRLREACLAAIVGNVIEFDIPKHEVIFEDMTRLIEDAQKDLAVDEIEEIYEAAEKSKAVLFLTDNAGEIVFDKILVGELKRLGAKVIVAVKGRPVLNDATMEDAEFIRMRDVADHIITTGTDAVGMPPPGERSEELVSAYGSVDLVIAKGMGYAETLTELTLKQPHALLLRTKCNPMAMHFGVQRGKNVAKLLRPT